MQIIVRILEIKCEDVLKQAYTLRRRSEKISDHLFKI